MARAMLSHRCEPQQPVKEDRVMDKMLIATFDEEKKAYEGSRILKDLDAEGSLTVYATAVIGKDASGNWTVRQEADRGPLGMGVGLFTGTMLGLLGGPVGVAIGAGVGAFGGALYDLAEAGVSGDFLAEAGEQLRAGNYAVVAEVWEEWTMPVDSRLEAAGGVVVRRGREEFVDVQLQREAAALKTELAELEAERARVAKEDKAKLDAKVEAVKAKLRATQERTKAALAEMKAEDEAKINVLRASIAKSRGEARAKMEARIAERRAAHERRTKLLHEAWELTKQALAD
jgi:uncharacterized membrane protein